MQTTLPLSTILPVMARYEWRSHLRAGQSCWLPAAFLLLVMVLWPMALPADNSLLQTIAPGLFWIGCLLSVILILDNLFQQDLAEQAILHWLQSPYPLPAFVLVRLTMVSLLFIASTLILLPCLFLLYGLPWAAFIPMAATVVLGIPTVIAVGGIVSALLVSSSSRALLLPLLLVPLWIPVLVFSTTGTYAALQGSSVLPHLALLLALLLIAFSLAPIAIATALRMSFE